MAARKKKHDSGSGARRKGMGRFNEEASTRKMPSFVMQAFQDDRAGQQVIPGL